MPTLQARARPMMAGDEFYDDETTSGPIETARLDPYGVRRAYKAGHGHPVVQRFDFRFLRPVAGTAYDVRDDYGAELGIVARSSTLGWRAYGLSQTAPLLHDDGSTRYWRRRQDAAYGLLCVAKECVR